MNRTSLIVQLVFFILYTLLLVFSLFAESLPALDIVWVLLFLAGALVSYWAHTKTGIVVIVLLAVHTIFEIMHHSSHIQTLSLVALVMLGIHLLFDMFFIKIEIQKHTNNPRTVFTGILLLYALIFAVVLLEPETLHLDHGSSYLEGILIGGILVCAITHSIGIAKRLKSKTNDQ